MKYTLCVGRSPTPRKKCNFKGNLKKYCAILMIKTSLKHLMLFMNCLVARKKIKHGNVPENKTKQKNHHKQYSISRKKIEFTMVLKIKSRVLNILLKFFKLAIDGHYGKLILVL